MAASKPLVVDEKGNKTAVIIDLKKYKVSWLKQKNLTGKEVLRKENGESSCC